MLLESSYNSLPADGMLMEISYNSLPADGQST